jgi:hypothetical protein
MANTVLTWHAAWIRLRKIINIPFAIAVEIRKDSRESSKVRRSLAIVLGSLAKIG